MKQLLPVFILTLFCEVASAQNPSLPAGGQYQVMAERPNEKTFKGIISRDILESDTSFQWYKANYRSYTANPAAKEGFEKYADSIQVLTFMGTWCEDSQFIIPRLFSLLDAAKFPADKVTLIGVDRKKLTLSHLSEALNVTNVPTIIILKNGVEQGRVVEYGKTGEFDKDLANIFNKMDKK
jgi:hypothetical protein